MSNTEKYKIIVIGDGKVGKTTYTHLMLNGKFTTRYTPTLGVEVHPARFKTNKDEELVFNIWDTAGVEKYAGLRDGYYIGADAAIVMFDYLSMDSFIHIGGWVKSIRRMDLFIPIVVCGNKVDEKFREVNAATINPAMDALAKKCGCNIFYYDLSVESGYNFYKPYLKLAQILKNDENLSFTRIPTSVDSASRL